MVSSWMQHALQTLQIIHLEKALQKMQLPFTVLHGLRI